MRRASEGIEGQVPIRILASIRCLDLDGRPLIQALWTWDPPARTRGCSLGSAEPGTRSPNVRATRSRNPERKSHVRMDGLDEPEPKPLRDRVRPGPGSEPQLDVVDKRLHGPL